jgi:peptide/nickel transport system substrate-binding protein
VRRTAALLLLASLVACSRAQDTAERRPEEHPLPAGVERLAVEGKFGGRLVHPLLRPPRSFNPLAAADEDTVIVTSLLHSGLLALDRTTMEVVPALASSWSVEDGGRTVRLRLREGVRFSDGEPFTADDVIFTLDAIYHSASHNLRRDDLTLRDQKIRYARVSASEVVLEFPFPFAPALYLISTIPILPRHLLKQMPESKPIEAFMAPDAPPSECVGLGPFRLVQSNNGQKIVLEANPHYWKADTAGRRLPYLDEIVLPVLSSRDSAFLQFKSGALDLDDRLRVEDFLSLADTPAGTLQARNAGASTRLDLLWVNQSDSFRSPKRAYFNNPVFRRALALSIDRKALAENAYRGQADVLAELWPPSLSHWSSGLEPIPYDTAKARALFAEAGLTSRSHEGVTQLVDASGQQLSLVLLINSSPVKQSIAAMLQQDLSRAGLRVQIAEGDQRAVVDRFLNKHDYEMVLFTLVFPPEPTDLQSLLKSRGEQHMWNPGQKRPATPWEAEIDRLLDEMIELRDASARRKVFGRIQRLLMEQLPVIPLVAERVLVGLRSDVANVRPSILTPHLLWNSWELYRK